MKKHHIGSYILIGLVVGIVLGALAKIAPAEWQPAIATVAQQIGPLGGLFNRIIFMVVIPIVFCSLVSGIATLGTGKIGTIGIRYYKLAAMMVLISIVIAFAASSIIQPNDVPVKIESTVDLDKFIDQKPILQRIVEFVPSNPFEAMVNTSRGGLIPVMIFAIFVGFAMIGRPENSPIRKLNDDILQVAVRIVTFAMYIAPLSVAILMFTTIVTTGWHLMASLLIYVLVLVGALTIQQVVVFSAVLLSAKQSPVKFFLEIREVMATALATASSAVTTPVAMRIAEENLKLKPEVSKLVLTLGVTGAKTATSIFIVVALVFLAKATGAMLDLGDYALIGITAFISGIVTAGVPSAAVPVIAGILVSIGAPAEAIGLVVAVDRVLDMLRTLVNVSGNMVIAQIIARK